MSVGRDAGGRHASDELRSMHSFCRIPGTLPVVLVVSGDAPERRFALKKEGEQ